MKLYTLEFNCNTPTTQQVNIPTNTDYKVGIKVTKNGEVLDIDPEEMTLGGTAADATKTNGYVTFTLASGDSAKYESKVVAIEMEDGFQTTFTLNINVYKSQQGDIGVAGSGGGVTEDWVVSYVSGELSDYATTGEMDAGLSAKADLVKQIPDDITSWITVGWDAETPEADTSAFTKLTSGFLDITPYSEQQISAQYVYGWDGYYTDTSLFSYLTNGKVVYAHKIPNNFAYDTPYYGNLSGEISCYYEVDTTIVPDGSAFYDHDESIDRDSAKWFGYVSENMDGQAPYLLQELTELEGLEKVYYAQNYFWHVATEEVTPGFIEVSAVYDNQLSGKVDQSFLTQYYYDSNTTDQVISGTVTEMLADYPTTSTMESYVDAQIGNVLSTNF